MWLCILTGRWFEETFENAQWSKMLLCILTSRRFEEAFENTAEKSQTNVTSAIMPLFEKAIWGHIWKRTVQWRKVKQMQPMWQCLLWSKPFQSTFENAGWKEKKHTYACNQCNYASIRAGHLRKHLKTFNLQLLYFHSFKILWQIQQIRDILLSPPPSLAIWLKDGWISIQPFWGTWWEIQPIPDGIFIRWMDFHLMVGIPSTLVRFPTTWMEIHPLGLVGPDVAVFQEPPHLVLNDGSHPSFDIVKYIAQLRSQLLILTQSRSFV